EGDPREREGAHGDDVAQSPRREAAQPRELRHAVLDAVVVADGDPIDADPGERSEPPPHAEHADPAVASLLAQPGQIGEDTADLALARAEHPREPVARAELEEAEAGQRPPLGL